jgi:glutaredoxin
MMKNIAKLATLAAALLAVTDAFTAFIPHSHHVTRRQGRSFVVLQESPNEDMATETIDINGFVDVAKPVVAAADATGAESSFFDNIVDNSKAGFDNFQKAQAAGYDFKTSLACVLAGEYDESAVQADIDGFIRSAGCVMFTWESSPSCKKAIEAFDIMGATYKNIRLDDPWDEGNKIRAEISKRVGQSSVPMIFIDGEYVGGYGKGASTKVPGILELAFKGTLRPKLEKAGALNTESN